MLRRIKHENRKLTYIKLHQGKLRWIKGNAANCAINEKANNCVNLK